MADTESFVKPQPLDSQLHQNQTNPSKFFTHFLYKAAIVTIFLLLLPLFPSQAPDFINQTRSWELLQLIFVGVAVSYGLFSKRNDETEKEHGSKLDHAQSYISGFLQVSSVFDDEVESPTGFDDNKVQTWNSQYYRGEPMVVVAQESSVLDEQRSTSSVTDEKPLLLPVRSLKSRCLDPPAVEAINESSAKTASLGRSSSNLGSKRLSNSFNKTRNGEFGVSNSLKLGERTEENVVLPSPIPWRSRSGRMEMKEDSEVPPLYSLPPSMEESEINRLESRSFRTQPSRPSRPNSTSPSPNNLSPSPSLYSPKKLSSSASLSPELHAKSVEDTVRKRIHYRSPPPPAPPPPPPLITHKHPLTKANSSFGNNEAFAEKELRRSLRSVPNSMNGNGIEDHLIRANSGSESRSRSQPDGSLMSRSFRTIRPIKSLGEIGEEDMNVVESDEESEAEEFEENVDSGEAASSSVSDGGPDVNKKADEFIAKFREQIRLQRIDSIKRSTGQLARNSRQLL